MPPSSAERSNSALAAARLSALLAPENPDAAEVLAASAARHVARARQARQGHSRPPVALAVDQELTPTPPPVGVLSERKYVHKGPTRSLVLNAFLQAVGQPGLVLPSTPVLNEHTLAPRLLECTRRLWAQMMMSAGDVDAALRLEVEVPAITNELAARFHVQRALGVSGELGDIARDYQEHRSQLGDPERDDREGGCIMATFAGRVVAHVEERLGPHVVDDVRASLHRILAESAPARRR